MAARLTCLFNIFGKIVEPPPLLKSEGVENMQ